MCRGLYLLDSTRAAFNIVFEVVVVG
jgi:hypothetical protein